MVVLGPGVDLVAAIDGLDAGTTILPISLPKEVFEVPSSEKPRMNAGGMLITSNAVIIKWEFPQISKLGTYSRFPLIPNSSK